jgi:hypothetical protein
MGVNCEAGRYSAGKDLLEPCVRNELSVGNSWFQRRKVYKITRDSWDGV